MNEAWKERDVRCGNPSRRDFLGTLAAAGAAAGGAAGLLLGGDASPPPVKDRDHSWHHGRNHSGYQERIQNRGATMHRGGSLAAGILVILSSPVFLQAQDPEEVFQREYGKKYGEWKRSPDKAGAAAWAKDVLLADANKYSSLREILCEKAYELGSLTNFRQVPGINCAKKGR
jgi:hypothetical protein